MKRLTADVIYGFAASTLHHRFDQPKPTPEVHKEWWELCCSDDPWVAIAAPRGHAKSTAITHTFTLACIVFRERKHILIVSDTEGQASDFLGDIKREFLENDELIQLFKFKRFIKDSEREIIGEFENGDQFRVLARGSEQKVRGRKWRNTRPDLIIGDDLENDEIVMNDDRRKKFSDWFDQALLEAGGDDCIVRVVGTILHMDSALENLMPQWNVETTKTDGLRFWTESDDPEDHVWKSVRYQAHNEDFSKILWPEKFPRSRLERIRRRYLKKGNPEGYAQEYLNYPIDESVAYFRKSDFIPMDEDAKHEYMEYYVGGDLAISEKDSRAYTVFVVVGRTAAGMLRIVDVVRFRGDSLEIIDTIFQLHLRYEPIAFFLEKENIMRSIWSVLQEKIFEENIFPNISEDTLIVPSADKRKRAQSIRARARAGKVEIDNTAEWYDDFITEMVQFDRGLYKDQVDALSLIGLGLNKMLDTPTDEELDEDEWEEEFGDELFAYDSGRDAITGY